MTKRSWDEAQSISPEAAFSGRRELPDVSSMPMVQNAQSGQPPIPRYSNEIHSSGRPAQVDVAYHGDDRLMTIEPPRAPPYFTDDSKVPRGDRKIKACAACRKQKIKCLIDQDGAPCRRCAKKDIVCVVNRGPFHTIMDERHPFVDALIQDLEAMHANMQDVQASLGMPTMAPLNLPKFVAAHSPPPMEDHQEDVVEPPPVLQQDMSWGPSRDVSPRMSARDDAHLPDVPIRSVYRLTKLSVLRSPATSDTPSEQTSQHPPKQNHQSAAADDSDFIARGQIARDDADRLFSFYMDHLDNYMYAVVGSRYSQLADMRRRSPILTAAVLTVAAMHDHQSNTLYTTCNNEFQRLVASNLLERRIDRDHLRALCVGSYWLYDTAWVLSGIASRRAAEFDINGPYQRISAAAEANIGGESVSNARDGDIEDAADFVRVWCLIYICDQHLSTVYGRQCSSREDRAILGCNALVQSSTVTTGDRRLVSQVKLLIIIHSVRDVLGPESSNSSSTPAVLSAQMKGFVQQVDQWVDHWPSTFPEYQQNFRTSPKKLAHFHCSFAKMYIYSHTFRGLGHSPVPPQLIEAAHCAVAATLSILDMIILDSEVQGALVGLPCYLQSMISFACTFLSGLASLHGDDLISAARVVDLIDRLKQVYKDTQVGRWHLVHLMPRGLDKVVAMLSRGRTTAAGSTMNHPGATEVVGIHDSLTSEHHSRHSASTHLLGDRGTIGPMDPSMADLEPYFLMDTGMGMGSAQQMYFDGTNFGFGDINNG